MAEVDQRQHPLLHLREERESQLFGGASLAEDPQLLQGILPRKPTRRVLQSNGYPIIGFPSPRKERSIRPREY